MSSLRFLHPRSLTVSLRSYLLLLLTPRSTADPGPGGCLSSINLSPSLSLSLLFSLFLPSENTRKHSLENIPRLDGCSQYFSRYAEFLGRLIDLWMVLILDSGIAMGSFKFLIALSICFNCVACFLRKLGRWKIVKTLCSGRNSYIWIKYGSMVFAPFFWCSLERKYKVK